MISNGGTTTLGLYDFKIGLSEFGKAGYWVEVDGGYRLHQRVMLDNGNIVKNLLEGNTVNPNVSMLDWELDSSSSLTNKFNYNTDAKVLSMNVADSSKIPTNGVSGKMIVRVAQYAVGIGSVGSRYYICTSKGGIKDSYVFYELRRGVTTTTGSVGGNAELLRVTSVYEGDIAWTGRHGKLGESAVGDWTEVVYTPSGYLDANKFSRSITTGVDLWKYYQVQGTGLKYITFNTLFDSNGRANIQFYTTPASASDLKVYIDGVLYKTQSLVTSAAGVYRMPLESTTGYHTVMVERPTTGAVNVFGVNYSDVRDSLYGGAIDGFVMWHKNVLFTNSEGANDYAIVDSNSGLLGGSFHGGETLQQETFVIDGVVGNPLAAITLCKTIEIRQKTLINWSSVSMNTYSTHTFKEDGGYGLDVVFNGNLITNTFYTTMHTTPESFNLIVYPNIIDLAPMSDGFKTLDRSNVVIQEDGTTGKRVYTEMTLYNNDQGNIYGGATVRKVTGSYNKLYYGVAISSPQNITITTLKTSFRKQFV